MQTNIQDLERETLREKVEDLLGGMLPTRILSLNYTNYAKGLQLLQRFYERTRLAPTYGHKGKLFARPFTAKETIEARVTNYLNILDANFEVRSKEDRLSLFNDYLFTCTAVISHARKQKFKIIGLSPDLILMNERNKEMYANLTKNEVICPPYLPVEYDAIDAPEFSQRKLCNRHNILDGIENQGIWRAMVNDDIALLKAYRDIIKTERQYEKGMPFWIETENVTHSLRPVTLTPLSSGAGLDSMFGLSLKEARFLTFD